VFQVRGVVGVGGVMVVKGGVVEVVEVVEGNEVVDPGVEMVDEEGEEVVEA